MADNPLLRLLSPQPMQYQQSGAMPVMQQPQMAPQQMQGGRGQNFLRDLIAGSLMAYGGGGVGPLIAQQEQRRRQQVEMAQQQQAQQQSNATKEWLKSQGKENLIPLVDAGQAEQAIRMAMQNTDQPGPGDFLNAGAGRIYDARNRQWVAPPEQPQSAASTFDPAMPGPMPAAPSAPAQKAPAAPKPVTLTEGQSKDTVFATRGEGALATLSEHGKALTSLGQTSAGMIPILGNYMKTPEYQMAEQAGAEFLASILRKDTGAAVTPSEFDIYGSMYLPRPGDSPEALQQKEVARIRALEAIRAGMPPQAILNMEKAQSNTETRAAETLDPLGIR